MKKKTIAPDVLASIKATPQPRKRSHLTPRSMRLALEPRILFDAAAASAAVENFTDTALDAPPAPESQQAEAAATPDNSAIDTGAQGAASGLLLYADAEVQAIPNLGASAAYVQARLAAWAASGNFSTDAAALFSANAGSESWMANAELLRGALTGGEYALRVESRPSAELQGMLAAYSPTGTTGQPTIYLNAEWLATASVEAITPVLFEEIGHDFDHRLNGANDTQGDEGHAFASLMVTGDANQAAVAGEDDHRTLLLSGQAVVVESAGPYAVAQITFVPLPEQELNQALRLISPTDANANNNIESIIAFTVTSNNTIVVYDHWEDGYEADIKNPVQSTTLIWGDGNTANGTAPGTANDILTTGQTITLRNTVNITTTQTVIDFDGKDKIGSSKAITTTRAGWNSGIGSILAGAVNVFDTGTAGSTYVIPVGTNTVAAGGTFTTVANPTLFESSTVHIMAFEDGTVVNIDKDANGTFETVVTLYQGGTYVATGVVAGAKINTVGGKNVGVYMINGDIAPPGYENRWFSIAPREDWSDDYYSPVGTTSTTLQPGYAFLYNPNATAITVNVETLNTSGVKVTTPIAIAANSSKYFQMPASAAHFKSADGSKYYAVQVMDGASGSSTDVDWSFALVPETYLTDRLVAAFAPGSVSTPPSTAPLNGSPLWVTPVADTFLYLDHAAITASTFTVKDALGNVVAGTAVDGDTYKYPVKVLQSYRITDNTDKDQSGTMMYTVDGTFLAGAWGEDGSVAGPASPYLDMGNALLPFPDYTLTKTSKEASPAQFPGASNGDGKVQLGEQIEYTLTVVNKSVVDLFNILFQDNPANLTSATYVANSATLTVFDRNGNVIRSVTDLDGATNTFPLSGAGYVLDDANSSIAGNQGFQLRQKAVITYRMQVRGNLDGTLVNDNYKINNSATISGPLDPKTTPNALTLDYTPTDGLVATSSGANPTYRSGSPITITVTDGDQNRNTAVADTITAQVTNLATGELESVTLTETGPNTGIFTVALPTVTSATSNGNNNGTLAVAEGNQVRVTYTDPLSGNVFDSPTLPGTNVANGYTVGNTNTVTVTIDNPPVAGNDATTYVPGSPVTVSVLGNDTTGDTPVPGTVSIVGGTDTNSDGTLDRLVVLGEGTWQVNASGQIVFTPQSGFLGSPTPINYTVKDAQGNVSNPASVTVTATALADLVTVKTLVSADSTPNVGDTVQFRIRVTNNGPSTATSISLTDTLPAGLTLITVGPNAPSATAGTFTAGTGVWSILSLANGAFADLLISATVNGGTAGTTQTNTTTKATGAQLDLTDAGNDLVEVVVVNDVPVAAADTNNVTEGRTSAPSAATGNVFAGGPGADTIGANTTVNPVTQIRAGAGTPNVAVNAGTTSSNGTVVTGTYGTLTLGANGTYSYALDNTNPTVNALNNGGTLTELFTYRITDADGDFSDTTLTITINGVTDNAPSITAIDGNAGATGQVTVSEAGLTSAANTSESSTGTLSLSADNGLQSITVGGTAVPIATLNALATGPVTITTPKGVITLTGFTPGTTLVGGFPTTGTVNYTYTLTQVQNTPAATENTDVIALTVTDQSNFSSNGTLTVQIIDDVPVANPDTNSVAEGITTASTTTTGNVFAAGSTGDRTDVIGADGAASPVTAVSTGGVLSGSPTLITAASPAVIAGTYGTLTLRADGSYSYALDNNNPAVDGLASGATLTETFTYQIKDADGDAATTQLTITINGATDPLPVITPLDGNGAANGQATVFEAGLTSAADTTETTTGGIAISAQAGIASVNIGGTSLTLAQLNALATTPVTINTPQGTLVLTGYTGNGTQGTVNYTYTLKTPVSNGVGVTEVIENIAISVTDANAVPLTANGTLSVRIVDDTPTANPDTNSVTEGITAAATATSGNVFANGGTGDTADRIGADGAANPVTRVIAGTGTPTTAVPAGAAGVNVTGTYGTLTLKSDGTYTYVLDNMNVTVDALTAGQTLTEVFTYRISDSDADTSDTTLTITINGVTDPAPAIVAQDGNGAATGQATVFEAGLTSNADNSETTTGVLAIEAQNNIASINVGGTTVTLAQLNNLAASPITVVTPKGTLVLTGYTGNNTQGTVAYSYTLNQPQNTPGVAESTDVIALSITPGTGSPASGALTVRIVNDTPTANADTNTVTEALGTTAASTATGNVFAGGGTGDVADRIGADGATSPVTAVALGFGTPSQSVTPATPATVAGTYGTLTLRADGSYSYALNNANTTVDNLNTGETLTERFTYRIADKDGDYADTTLTITINGVNDGAPSITPVDGNGAATGQTTVFEAGLNNAADASETGTGVISLAAPAGITSITVGGTTVTLTQLNSLSSTPITITTPKGTIVLTGYNGNTTAGNLTYSYTLSAAQNTPGAAESTDVISLVVTDAATATATGSLTVRIVDDTPAANADTNTVVEGVAATPTFAIGNVFGSGDTSDVADRIGADGATSPVTAASFGNGTPATAITPASPAVITGAYGTLTLRADGSYSYALDNTNGTVNSLSTGQTLTETFSYRIADKDGDYSDTTLTITINGVDDANRTIVADDGNGTATGQASVFEAGLNIAADTSEITTGSIVLTGGNGIQSANVGGTTLTLAQLKNLANAPVTITTPKGTLLLTGFSSNVGDTQGTLNYTYTLKTAQNTPGANENTDTFALSVTDSGGTATGSLTVRIVDDAPVARADTNSVNEGNNITTPTLTTGNVFTGGGGDVADRIGADGATNPVTLVIAGAGTPSTAVTAGTTSGNGTVVNGTYGTLTLGSDGSYSYALENNNAAVNALLTGQTLIETYTYRIVDSDGDFSDATLTITINGVNDGPPSIASVDGNGTATGQVSVFEAGLNVPADTSETNTGSITLTAANGINSTAADAVTVGGTTLSLAQLNNLATSPITITTAKGTLILTGFTASSTVGGVPTAGSLTYSYTLSAAQNTPGLDENTDGFALAVKDQANQVGNGALLVRIVDDLPTARPDVNSVTEGNSTTAPSVITGNVYTNGSGGDQADRIGADGAANPVTLVAAGPGTPGTAVAAGTSSGTGTSVTGIYGTLKLGSDGSYSYALDNTNATVNALTTGQSLTETFTYRIADADGDIGDTTLTITINGVDDGPPSITPADANGAATGQNTVSEAGLNVAADTSETVTGTIAISAPNNINGTAADAVTIGGTQLSLAQLQNLAASPVTITTAKGTLVLTGYTGGILGGNIAYTYTLSAAQNTPGLDETTDNFALTVKDAQIVPQVASGTLVIRIVDDTPTARADTNTVTEGIVNSVPSTVRGNVFANGDTSDVADRIGADAVVSPVTAVSAGNGTPATAITPGTPVNVAGAYGTLTLRADGSYTYALDNNNATVNGLATGQSLTETFSYRITDADGDTSDTTLTITVVGVTDSAPAIIADDGNGAATGQATVLEAGLVNGDNTQKTTGTISIDAGDGLNRTAADAVTIGGTTLSLAQLNNLSTTPITITTAKGTLTLTGFAPLTTVGAGPTLTPTQGVLSYTYTLTAAQNTPNLNENTDIFALAVKDVNNVTANGNLTVRIVDDAPAARADTNSVNEGNNVTTPTLANGNVFNGTGGDVADRIGADGAANPVTLVSAGSGTPSTAVAAGTNSATGTVVNGAYGTLTLGADGSYSYALNNNSAAVNALTTGETLTETFTYRIVDADGDISDTTLTITINGVNDGPPSIVPADGNGAANGQASVFEAGLTSVGDTSETVTGSITISAGNGINSTAADAVTVGGTSISLAQLNNLGTVPVVINTAKGTLTLTGFTATSLVGGIPTLGTLAYTYTLATAQNTPGLDENSDGFALIVKDDLGVPQTASGTLVIRIVDDQPTARADTNRVNEGANTTAPTTTTGNVFGAAGAAATDVADRIGADGAAAGGPVTLVSAGGGLPTTAAGAAVTGLYGTLTLNANGTYSYALNNNNSEVNALGVGQTLTDVFTYRIADGDGDLNDTTLTITINGVDDGLPSLNPVDGNGAATGQVTVSEAGLTSAVDTSETNTGSITLTAPDGLDKVVIGGVTIPLSQLSPFAAPVEVVTPKGAIVITGFTGANLVGGVPTTGTLTYSYTLGVQQTNTTPGVSPPTDTESSEAIALSVVDRTGDVANGTLTVRIVDDVPTANADTNTVAEGTTAAATTTTGNVFTGGGGDVADRIGADTPANPVTQVRAGAGVPTTAPGTAITGTYGTLTLNADGSYSYAVDNANATVNGLGTGQTLTDIFTYRITDADGDFSDTTLTITINGTDDGAPAIVPVDGNGAAAGQVTVNEAGLTSAGDTSETNTGSINLTAADGLQSITVGGTMVTLAQLNTLAGTPVTIVTPKGAITLTGFTPGTLVGGVPTAGTLNYSYTLNAAQNNNTVPTATEITDPIALVITDASGETANGTLTVRIVDDVPAANADTNTVAEGTTAAPTITTGNVFTGTGGVSAADRIGADNTPVNPVTQVRAGIGVPGTAVAASTNSTNGTAVVGTYGTLTLGADGSYSYALDNTNAAVQELRLINQTLTEVYTYRITDADGDTSDTTLTITITGVNDAPVGVNDAVTAIEAGGVLNGIAGANGAGNVLTNDTDPDSVANGETKTVSAVRLGAVEGAGTAGTVGTGLVGTYGTLTLNANGSYTYVIDNTNPLVQALRQTGQTVTESFNYSVTDAGGLSDIAVLTVTIDGRNDAPVAIDDVAAVAEASAGVPAVNATGNVLPNDTDVDTAANGETKTVAGVRTGLEAAGGALTNVAPGSNSTNGAVVVGTYGTLTLGADGSYSYAVNNNNATVNALTAGQTLTETFTYQVADAAGATDLAALTITINGTDDGVPAIVPVDGNGAATGQVTVNEAGLTSAGDTSETNTGAINLTAPDGLQSVTVGGTVVTLAQLNALAGTPITITTPKGTVTLTGFTPGTLVGGVPTAGTLAYSYTLTAAQNNNTAPAATETTDPIALVITEASGETAAGTLTVRIVDDVPTASPDTNNVAEGLTNAPSVATGNVFAGGGAGDIADRIGADGAARPVMAVAAGNATPTTPVPAGAPAVVAGSFGTLTLNGDGSYSYALDNANATVNGLGTGQTLSEVFTYRIADSDGDFSDTTLTITINGVNDGAASIIPVDGNGGATGQTSVFEAGLGNAADTSETATGVIILTAPNGIQSVNIGGTPVTLAQLNALSTTPVTIVTPKGTLVLTGFTPVSSVGGIATQGNLSYSYTVNQAQNTPGLNESTDILALSITDASNATAAGNLTVRIADSLPTANPDTNSVTESLTVTPTFSTGNVFGAGSTGDATDLIGADNTPVNPVTQVVAGVGVPTAAVAPGTTSANGTNVTGIYGTLTLGANGSYSYALDNNNATVNGLTTGQTLTEVFTYRITDADGDTSDTTLTITINGVTDGVPSILAQDGNGGATGQATVQEAGLGNAADTSEITTGRIVVTAPDGLASVNIGGTLVPRAALANLGTTPVTIVTPKGTLVLNSFTPVSLIGGIPTQGNLDYTYTLNQAQNTPGLNENTDVFALTVTDVNSAAATGTLTVRIVDDAPVANADRNTVNEGTANTPTTATGNIVAGGSATDVADRIGADATANPVTGIAAGFGAPATPVPAGTPAAVTGSFGTLMLSANGTYTYALDNTNATVNALRPGQTLTETFTYRITDADGDISDATLTLTIRGANDAPVAAPDTGTTPEDTPVSGNVLSNDADPDSVLSVTQFVVNGITFAAGQTATLNGIGTLVIRADGSYTFAPAPDYSGPVPVATYTVSDGLVSTTSTLTLAVTPVTDPPAVSAQNVTADAGQPSTLTLGASVTDRLLNDAGAERLTSLTLSGIPAGSLLTLANGTPVPVVNGVAALRAEDLAGLRFTPPASAVGDIKLTLSSTAQDGSAAPVTRSTDFVVSVRAIPITDGPSMTLETFNGIQNVPPRGILILQSPVADTSIFEYGDIQPDVPRLPIPFHPIVFVNNEVEASQRAREDSDARTSGGDPRVFRVGNSLPGSLGSNLGFIPNLFVQGSVRQSQEISARESTEVDGREGVIALSSDGLLNTPSVFQPQNLVTASVAPRVDLPAFAEHDAGRTTMARWEEPTPQPVPVLADRGTPRTVSPPVASAFSEQLKLAGKRLHAKPWLLADRPQKTPARAADRV